MGRPITRTVAAALAAAACLAAGAGGAQATSTINYERVLSVAPSPGFAADRTVLALTDAGSVDRSTDGGATWQTLSSLPGARSLFLAPAYPTDPAVYAVVDSQTVGVASLNGVPSLERSDDGGRSFRVASPVPGPAVALPGGAPGRARIVIGGPGGLFVYHEDTGRLTRGPLYGLQHEADTADAVAVLDQRVLVHLGGTSRLCDLSMRGCTGLGTVGPDVVVPAHPDGTALWTDGNAVIGTLDHGRTIARRSVIPGYDVVDLALSWTHRTDHTVIAAASRYAGHPTGYPDGFLLLVSHDDAATWAPLPATGLPTDRAALIEGVWTAPTGAMCTFVLDAASLGGLFCTDASGNWVRAG